MEITTLNLMKTRGVFMSNELKVIETDDVPALAFGNKYLSMFRGYRMQVSKTAEGVFNLNSSETTLHHDISFAIQDLAMDKEKFMRNVVLLAHTYAAVSAFPEFWEAIKADESKLVKLLEETEEFFSEAKTFEFSIEECLSLVQPVDPKYKTAQFFFYNADGKEIHVFLSPHNVVLSTGEEGYQISLHGLIEPERVNTPISLSFIENVLVPILAMKANVPYIRNNVLEDRGRSARIQGSNIFG